MASRPKMTWEKSSAGLVELFHELAPKGPQVEVKKMFGWPSVFVNGNLAAGLHKESMLFRLSGEDQAVFLGQSGAREFEPMPGRKMRGFVMLAEPLIRDRKELRRWMERSLDYARSLPPKVKKSPPKARK